MNNVNKKKGLHLSYEDRLYIQTSLDCNMSFQEIAKVLHKHPTTISKEVRKHMVTVDRNTFNAQNQCAIRYDCHRMNVCNSLTCTRKQCRSCGKCNATCKHFKLEVCKRYSKPPYVCNGCVKSHLGCRFQQYHYKASIAQREYISSLHESRVGINMSKAQLAQLDELVSPLILKGQSVSHIYSTHKDEIPCSLRTIYSYVEKQYFTIRNLDLRRKVRYKLRKKRHTANETMLAIKLQRRYRDFVRYIEEFDPDVVEMDTVMGSQSSTVCLFTILFRKSRMMFAFLLKEKTQAAIIDTLDNIEYTIGSKAFSKLFPVILTDNGSEFLSPHGIERSISGGRRTLVYYCDPNSAFQKGAIEKNHEYIRYVVPKGIPFDSFSQEDINRLLSHINSTTRESLGNRSPFDSAPAVLLDACEKLGLKKVLPDDVNLTASLLFK